MFVTAGLDKKGPVKIWDIRKLNLHSPIMTLLHDTGVNVARFNPTDGTKLLTSDQGEEIRIYDLKDSSAEKPIIIKHPHKQFQHITP
jgi:WD40 repeat protein